MSTKSRTYHDPVHGGIHLRGDDPVDQLLIQLIDTPEFQRLRRIRQLDLASLTFHGAEGSRFTHALGVLAVARRVWDHLCIQHPELAAYRALMLTAALLHDVGHGPFSHAGEEVFGFDHEAWTCRIIGEQTQITQLLNGYQAGLADQLVHVFQGKAAHPLVGQLVSGQLDCDRLDYLLRDSYFTGTQYGHLDLDRIITALAYDPQTQSLVVRGRKGLVAVEHYLVVRYFMYTQVYNHPKNLAARFVLTGILHRAKECFEQGGLAVDETLAEWLGSPAANWSLSTYLAADDVVIGYHLQRWQQATDLVLANLCRQLVNRNLPKFLEITDLGAAQQQRLLERLYGTAEPGQAPYTVGIKTTRIKGYSLYDKGIYLQSEAQEPPKEIADCSPLVRALVLTSPKVWLIYPRVWSEQVQHLVAIASTMAGLGTVDHV